MNELMNGRPMAHIARKSDGVLHAIGPLLISSPQPTHNRIHDGEGAYFISH